MPVLNAEDIRAEINLAAVPADLKDILCKGWPTAKTVLEALRGVWTNPLANVIIGLVIAAGDAIQGAICK
jgi:hypothetical protein